MISSLFGFPFFLNFTFNMYAKLHLPFYLMFVLCKAKVFVLCKAKVFREHHADKKVVKKPF
jgi:hypothetical protein